LIAVVLLMTASVAICQSSTSSTPSLDLSDRERLISKTERAVQEVITSRGYIKDLEGQLERVEAEKTEIEKAGELDRSKLSEKENEAKELRESIAALKAANAERVKEIGKMQKKINDLQNKVSFWRKTALVFAAATAAVVLLN
jgi:chromosome segregation ATPase